MDIHTATEQAYKKGFADGRGKWIPSSDVQNAQHGKYYLCATKNAYTKDGYLYSVYLFVKNGREYSEYMKTDGPVFCNYDSEYGYIEHEPDFWRPIESVGNTYVEND